MYETGVTEELIIHLSFHFHVTFVHLDPCTLTPDCTHSLFRKVNN